MSTLRSIRSVALMGGAGLLAGCASVMPGPGGVLPGLLVNSTTSPALLTADVVYQAHPDSFVAVGLVEGSSSSKNFLGLFSFGNSGLRAAMDNARRQANADGLVNCVADVRSSSFLGLFSSSKTIVRGVAIRRRGAAAQK